MPLEFNPMPVKNYLTFPLSQISKDIGQLSWGNLSPVQAVRLPDKSFIVPDPSLELKLVAEIEGVKIRSYEPWRDSVKPTVPPRRIGGHWLEPEFLRPKEPPLPLNSA